MRWRRSRCCCLAATLVLISKPWRLETFTRRMAALMVCAYGGLFLGMWVQRLSGVSGAEVSIWRMSVATLSFQGAGLVLVARFLREHQTSWAEGFGFLNQRRQAVLLGLLAALIFLPLGWGLQQASALVMTHLPHFKLEPQEQLPVHALRVSVSWGGGWRLGRLRFCWRPWRRKCCFAAFFIPRSSRPGFRGWLCGAPRCCLRRCT